MAQHAMDRVIGASTALTLVTRTETTDLEIRSEARAPKHLGRAFEWSSMATLVRARHVRSTPGRGRGRRVPADLPD